MGDGDNEGCDNEMGDGDWDLAEGGLRAEAESSENLWMESEKLLEQHEIKSGKQAFNSRITRQTHTEEDVGKT